VALELVEAQGASEQYMIYYIPLNCILTSDSFNAVTFSRQRLI
jgi:hypothetical protein